MATDALDMEILVLTKIERSRTTWKDRTAADIQEKEGLRAENCGNRNAWKRLKRNSGSEQGKTAKMKKQENLSFKLENLHALIKFSINYMLINNFISTVI